MPQGTDIPAEFHDREDFLVCTDCKPFAIMKANKQHGREWGGGD
jgi:hypothetical protein